MFNRFIDKVKARKVALAYYSWGVIVGGGAMMYFYKDHVKIPGRYLLLTDEMLADLGKDGKFITFANDTYEALVTINPIEK